jgi:metal-responsive CopG/Arc/MetJ family transcriptional regulator
MVNQAWREIMLNVKLDAELSKEIARQAKREKISRTAVVRTAVTVYLEEAADAADVAKRKHEGVISLQQLGKHLGLED